MDLYAKEEELIKVLAKYKKIISEKFENERL
jgi:hypothetical protein